MDVPTLVSGLATDHQLAQLMQARVIASARALVSAGVPADEVAAALGVSRATLYRRFADNGPDLVQQLATAVTAVDGPDECDACGGEGATVRGSLDLTGSRVPAMVLERLCAECRTYTPDWPLA